MKRYVFVRPARNVLIPSKDDVPHPHQEIWTSVLQVHTETIDETPGTSVFVSVRVTGLFPNRTGLNWIWFCENLRVASLACLEVWSETPQNTKFISSEWGIMYFMRQKTGMCWWSHKCSKQQRRYCQPTPNKKTRWVKRRFYIGFLMVIIVPYEQCLVSANKFCLVR